MFSFSKKFHTCKFSKNIFSSQTYSLCTQSIHKPGYSNGLNDQVTAILGAQWGDEGKGKLVDILSKNYDICGRFNGGSNAGHTLVINGKKFAMHLLPCGVLSPNMINIIGNGCVIHIPTLCDELQMLVNNDIDYNGRIKISDRAHIVFDFHQLIDGILETNLDKNKDKDKDKDKNKDKNKDKDKDKDNTESNTTDSTEIGSIGTTKRGIGPTYASKMFRNNIRIGELKDWTRFKDKYLKLIDIYSKQFNINDYNYSEELKRFENYRHLLLPMIDDTVYYINKAYNDGKKILLEGANAIMLDIDYGTYPMVTSSNTSHGGIITGIGLSNNKIHSKIGIVKAYTTRVGHGPFPTELKNNIGKHIQKVGHEYGTTTGRARRCGWIDIPILRYSHLINDYNSVNITKLDVLDELDEVCIGKSYILNGKRLDYGIIPSNIYDLHNVEVEYEKLPGWKQNISKIRDYNSLPQNCKNYIERVQELMDCPVSWVGVGPDREEIVLVK